MITEFSSQYKYINRYLPVYKLTFARHDEMQVYVETCSSKLATYNPKSRQIFIWIFDTFHNWGFIDAIANNYLRIITMLLFISIILFSAISGIVIYGFMWKKFKKATPTNSEGFLRKNHRTIGIIVSFLTLTFAFSGGYHAIQKWEPNILSKMIYEPIIKVSDIKIPSTKTNVDWNRLVNLSIIKFKKEFYYQCDLYDAENEKWEKQFVNTNTNLIEKNVEINYAKFLVTKFSKMLVNPTSDCCETENSESFNPNFILKSSSILTDFDKREYGFVNKRLPVVKLEYNSDDDTTYYIETSTSRLAAVVNSSTRREGYSFAIFHKFLLMEWAGKNIRDFMTIFAALGILIVSILGLILFLKKK
ncbi:PepSY domain-containing protein [Flavobacterium sp.]|uniref:PepSY domain-containing protein n=1 Tax=Flavobacterium sp. TaxID=239 RepID=UPI0037517F71